MFISSFSILRTDGKSRGKSQISFPERYKATTPNDQVINCLDIQEFASLDDGPSDGDVVLTGA